MLAGISIEKLNAAQVINLAEVVVMEPALSGALTTIDDALNAFAERVEKAYPDREKWGTSDRAQAGAQAMLDLINRNRAPSPPSDDPAL